MTAVQRKRHLGDGERSLRAAAGGARLVLFPAAPGLYGRRTDDASWQAGFSWWEGCSLGDARRHARRLGQWIALPGQAGVTEGEDFPGFAALVSPAGDVTARLPDWREATLIVDIPPKLTGMPQDWEYLCTANPHDAATLTDHMNQMARRGWELLTVTSSARGETGTHLFFWRRPAGQHTG